MLLLSRKHGEYIILETSDGLVEIMIASVHDHPVRLGIQAPKQIPVWRKEIYEERQKAKQP